MPDELRINLNRSRHLRHLIAGARWTSAFTALGSYSTGDFRLLATALGFVLLSVSLARMDPSGITLRCRSIRCHSGQWLFKGHGEGAYLSCDLCHRGRLALLLYLECGFNRLTFDGRTPNERTFNERTFNERRFRECSIAGSAPPRRLLIFADAMSDEHWRLLRRQLRLQRHVNDV